MKEVLHNIHLLSLGGVNAFLIDHGKMTLIDTGYAGNGQKIFGYLEKIGKSPDDLENIIITHLHSDHCGSLAEIRERTDARVYMHEEDAQLIEKGISFREQLEITPGLIHKIVFRLFVKGAPKTVTPFKVDHLLKDNQTQLQIGKGFRIIRAPGHARGQIALLYEDHGGVLFAADTAGNMFGLGLAPFYEDYQQGLRDLRTLSENRFNHLLFGHGGPVLRNADEKFRKKFKRYLEMPAKKIVSNPN